jgi:type I site-specific restriction endonuclease
MPKEAKARILINDLLRRSRWRFFDDESGPANIALEAHVKLKKKTLEDLGDDFEKTANGYVDYLLLGERGFPIAVLEAKSEKFDPLVGKEQARKYAHSQNVRFVILSNGNLHYFWDLEQGNPVLITEFPTPDSLGHFHAFKPNPAALVGEKIETDYIAVTQNPNYRNDPRWNDAGQHDGFIKDAELKFLRPYQLRAVVALQDTVRKGQTRFLFEMATGTGKTLTAAAWPDRAIVQQLAAQIPWFHNCILRDRVQGPADREWYIRQTIQNGWSRNILALQIESRLHERQGKAITNFPATATASIGEATAHVRSPQSGRRIDLVARPVAALIGFC